MGTWTCHVRPYLPLDFSTCCVLILKYYTIYNEFHLTKIKTKSNGSGPCSTCCWNNCNLINIDIKKKRLSWQNICNIIHLPHKKCEGDHVHCDVTQTTTVWLEVSKLVTTLIVVNKNGVRIDVAFALVMPIRPRMRHIPDNISALGGLITQLIAKWTSNYAIRSPAGQFGCSESFVTQLRWKVLLSFTGPPNLVSIWGHETSLNTKGERLMDRRRPPTSSPIRAQKTRVTCLSVSS